MPASLTYPGVYIEELSSGVHTISGVSTSMAAFVGWAAQGPTDQATLVTSWGDFQAQFGGLDSRSYLGYSVNQFFANGGQQAYIIRLVMDAANAHKVPTTPPPPIAIEVAKTAVNTPVDSPWKLFASSPGIWANAITVAITPQPANSARFSLQVLLNSNPVENFVNLSMAPADPQFVFTVINNDSQYVTFIDPSSPQSVLVPPTALPASTDTGFAALGNGADGTVLVPGDGNFENAIFPEIIESATGVHQLDRVNIFNLLCVPGVTPVLNAYEVNTVQLLQDYCASRRAFYIADGPQTVIIRDYPSNGPGGISTTKNAANSAFYFPWVLAADPLTGNRPRSMPPCGFVGRRFRSCNTVVDDTDAIGPDEGAPRVGDEAAGADHPRAALPQRKARQPAHEARKQVAVGMEEHGHTQTGISNAREQARTGDINEIGREAGGETADLAGEHGGAGDETGGVHERLGAGGVGTAADADGLETGFADAGEQFAVAGQAGHRFPAPGADGGKQFQEALLRAAGIAELIEEEKLHTRTATASTQK